MRRAMLAALATAAAAATLPAGAQNWPSRPVRVLVPYPPGSGTDIIGRVLAEKLQAAWGQPVVVENRPGGGGTIGTEAGARAAPDGHTFLISDVGPLAMAPSLYARLPYDPVRDFEAVGLVARLPFVLATHPAVPARTAAEFVALAKARPGGFAYAYASVGNGSATHLAMELFRASEGIELTHVPYRGSAPALNDLVAGQVAAMFVNTASSADLIREGRLRALAVGARAPSPVLPGVPTLSQASHGASPRQGGGYPPITQAPASSAQTTSRNEPVSVLAGPARTTSHSVGAQGSRTTIPLTAGRAQEARPVLDSGFRSHACVRFARLDPSGPGPGPAG